MPPGALVEISIRGDGADECARWSCATRLFTLLMHCWARTLLLGGPVRGRTAVRFTMYVVNLTAAPSVDLYRPRWPP